MTEPRAVSAASVTLNAGETQAPIESLRIIAKPGTAIDGTAGNEWTIDLDVRSRRPSSWSVTQTTSVQVSVPNQHILVVALSGPADSATIGEVADDLEALRDFNRLFTIERLGLDFETPIDTGGRKRFTGGAAGFADGSGAQMFTIVEPLRAGAADGYGAGGFTATISVNGSGNGDDTIAWQPEAFINTQ